MKIATLCVGLSCWLLAAQIGLGQDVAALFEDNATVKKLSGNMAFVEGPVWIPATKTLIFSDIPNGKLMKWSEASGLSEFRKSENSNGNILDLEGRLISCQHSARNIVRTEFDGKITVLADKFAGQRFNSPNDVAVRSDGTLWFTDPPWGLNEAPDIKGNWVFKLDPTSGEVQPIIRDLAMPNGINFSPDESRLYVADTGGHPKHPDPSYHKKPAGIHCYEVSKDGTLGKKLFTIEHGSDGMAVDVLGNLYTTNENKIKVHDQDGKPLGDITVPEGPANCAFGGDDFKTLFITARTSLYSIRLKNAGAKPRGAKW